MKGNTPKKPATATRQSIKVGAAKTIATKPSATTKRATSSSTKPKTTKATKATTTAKTMATPKTRSKPESSKPQVSTDVEVQPKRQPLARARANSLRKILLAKREAIMKQMREQLGQSLTDDQQRQLESAMDSGDQALFDLEREMGISLQEMRNRERQLIEEALSSLDEGTFGLCAECDEEISEKRLEALPFARHCIKCQSRLELLEKIEKGEQRS